MQRTKDGCLLQEMMHSHRFLLLRLPESCTDTAGCWVDDTCFFVTCTFCELFLFTGVFFEGRWRMSIFREGLRMAEVACVYTHLCASLCESNHRLAHTAMMVISIATLLLL